MPVATPGNIALTEEQVQRIAKALADARRYDILKKLSAREAAIPCSEMLAGAGISPATLSHHMRELELAGLVRAEKDGKFVRYSLQQPVLRAFLDRLQGDLA
jgi:ArsR family transcriptional regulator